MGMLQNIGKRMNRGVVNRLASLRAPDKRWIRITEVKSAYAADKLQYSITVTNTGKAKIRTAVKMTAYDPLLKAITDSATETVEPNASAVFTLSVPVETKGDFDVIIRVYRFMVPRYGAAARVVIDEATDKLYVGPEPDTYIAPDEDVQEELPGDVEEDVIAAGLNIVLSPIKVMVGSTMGVSITVQNIGNVDTVFGIERSIVGPEDLPSSSLETPEIVAGTSYRLPDYETTGLGVTGNYSFNVGVYSQSVLLASRKVDFKVVQAGARSTGIELRKSSDGLRDFEKDVSKGSIRGGQVYFGVVAQGKRVKVSGNDRRIGGGKQLRRIRDRIRGE